MQWTPMAAMNRIALGTLLIATFALTSAAEANDRLDRARKTARAELREAQRLDRKLDRRGERIDQHLDFLALVAAVSGEYGLARELDRRGDRIERRYDRRGDRLLHAARVQVRDTKHLKQRKNERRRGDHSREMRRGHRGAQNEIEKRSRRDRRTNGNRRMMRLEHDGAFALHLHLRR